jgi:hypothetical protein
VLASVAALLVGVSGIVEYVGQVLPAQAAAETGYVYQYSLTYLLRTLGSPPAAALVAGDVSYAAMLALGIWLGRRAAQRLGRPELVAFLPAACSVTAGPYVHMVDLAFAIPAALVLATSLQGRAKTAATVALCLLAVPWIAVWITKKLFLATLFVVAAILLRVRAGTSVAIGTFLAIAASIYFLELVPPAPLVATTTGIFFSGDLAQQAWGAYVAQLGNPSPTWLLVKVPTWLALAAMLAVALSVARQPRSAGISPAPTRP